MGFDGRRRRNLRAIEQYVTTIRASRYPGTAGSLVETLQFTGKPQSSAPHTSAGERHLSVRNDKGDELPERVANARTRRIVEPVIEGYLRSRYSDSYWLLELAPTEMRSWKSGATQDARESAWRFARAIGEVEAEVEKRNPGVVLEVYVNPEDEPLAKEGAPHHRNRRVGVEDSRRNRYKKLRKLEQSEDITRSAAVEMIAKQENVSPATIWRCVELCEDKAS